VTLNQRRTSGARLGALALWAFAALALPVAPPAEAASTPEPRALTTTRTLSSAEAAGPHGAASVVTATAEATAVRRTDGASPGAQDLAGAGFTYSHDWGDRRGQWILNLNWSAVRRNSRVFVSAGECQPGGGKFIGAARYTVHNVAQTDGRVSARVNIEWNSDIRLCVDYLVINP